MGSVCSPSSLSRTVTLMIRTERDLGLNKLVNRLYTHIVFKYKIIKNIYIIYKYIIFSPHFTYILPKVITNDCFGVHSATISETTHTLNNKENKEDSVCYQYREESTTLSESPNKFNITIYLYN